MLPGAFSFSLPLAGLGVLLILSLIQLGAALDLPANVREFYDAVRVKGRCTNELANGFYSTDGGPNSMPFPAAPLKLNPVIVPRC